ncbi:hypothetical protein CCR85_00870 [Rhodothalassium salexigens]|nr:hypothetical protein [Rhodothalassium salexigens]MBK5921546.1 hypothetical protein [Rhodothalassium salexigens]
MTWRCGRSLKDNFVGRPMQHYQIKRLLAATASVVAVAFMATTASAQESENVGPTPEEKAQRRAAAEQRLEQRTDKLGSIFDEAAELNKIAQNAQEEINDLSNQTSRLVSEYTQLLKQIEGLKAYNAQQERLIQSQEEEKAEFRASIRDVQSVRRQITPLMLRMVGALERFVELDMPFQLDERRERIAGLRDLLDQSNVATPEKFRRVLEVYQIENEYSRFLNAYEGTLTIGGEEKEVKFLRAGRVALVYETLDGSSVGFYNKNTGSFEPLGDQYRSAIEKGLEVANQQASPSIISLPVSGPEQVQ